MVNSNLMICTGRGQLVSVSVLVALCIKHASRVLKKIVIEHINPNLTSKSLLASPRQLITTIRIKVIPFLHKKRFGNKGEKKVEDGLWQKNILMGEKCQLPDFSGVIYYDCEGNQLSELPPRSPRGGQLQGFYVPTAIHGN
ncbi:hypothetical protein BVC80_1211g120 [Macleaya cordata]|uniref:Uncharacterized protein n=1 Tax=Macleaya cordata TaxID=56857 RepID=A0A200Q3L4_MACCD|nr:hypothetical protein BVC80_1211g120 [Macleaya cordata]